MVWLLSRNRESSLFLITANKNPGYSFVYSGCRVSLERTLNLWK